MLFGSFSGSWTKQHPKLQTAIKYYMSKCKFQNTFKIGMKDFTNLKAIKKEKATPLL